ncbi:PLP-dependent transferase [Stereum hirsutum FP-91666 SS1]|uniref:PLP-dependent transferase n=1 Tax=Stereum hirsutum (strain FP-91666) TaxID=721885 RepID=UPI000440CB1B|nr:PLP-dependent transferase [Stereum hirsutum FP-91666 SS1]EIM91031.1 PLP-dependent transferase [Stereum hirsutum FP-91666 SS1]
MSLLLKNLRLHQVFGANTDVGKTILTSALVRASASLKNQVYYLKPVSTGPMKDADDEHVLRYAGAHKQFIKANCLFRFDEPLSPHLAAQMASEKAGVDLAPPSDETFVTSVATYIRRCATQSQEASHMYVETAGGVHSPTLSGTTQLDSYRPLFLPTILIGDSRLGGISSTISSYESLLLRGYIVDAILLFKDDYYRNYEYLTPYFAERGVHVSAFEPPPPLESDPSRNFEVTDQYYGSLVPDDQQGGLFDIQRHLDDCHAKRISELESMPQRTLDTVWWPFVQHGLVKGPAEVNVIDSASQDFFSIYNGHKSSTATTLTSPDAEKANSSSLLEPQYDGSSSWWTQALGHAHPSLTLAAARASGRYGHVMFPQATHLPALQLSEFLVNKGPGKGWASRAFISDNGSTGMEVALKMALRAYTVRHGTKYEEDGKTKKALGIIGLKGSYHGDTIGAMDACEEGVYTCEWHQAKGYWFDPPSISIRNGEPTVTVPPAIAAHGKLPSEHIAVETIAYAYDVPRRLHSPLAEIYRDYTRTTIEKLKQRHGPSFAAMVLEPLVLGAGGMVFVDPLFQRVMIDTVRETFSSPPATPQSEDPTTWRGLPVIFDEVFVGLYRLGLQSTAPLLGVNPDISVNAKILTGGLLPLAVTLASNSIFEAFLSDKKTDALLHGHSYSAHAVGCEVANETLKIIEGMNENGAWDAAKDMWRNVATQSGEGLEGEKSVTVSSESEVWSFWDPSFVDAVSQLSNTEEVMTLGTVLAIKLKDSDAGYQSHSAQTTLQSLNSKVQSTDDIVSSAPGGAPFSIHFRTLGNVAYFMTSLNTSPATVRSVEDRIWAVLGEAKE